MYDKTLPGKQNPNKNKYLIYRNEETNERESK